VKLLLDEMYPAALAEGLRAASIDATTVAGLGKAGSSDSELFAFAIAGGFLMLTENVVDFAPIAAEHSTAGEHHHGLLIALSSRFSRRPAGLKPLITAIHVVASERLGDRIVHLERPDRE
jgi:hypothetical protein